MGRQYDHKNRNAKIVKLYDDGKGLTYGQLAERFGITRSDVSGILMSHRRAVELQRDLEACRDNNGIGYRI